MMKKLNFSSVTALATSITALFAFIVAFNTAPLSGPMCKAANCFKYPYLDIVSRYPSDYFWMVPTIIFIILYLITMICLRDRAKDKKQLFGQIAVVFASISTTILLITYFTQLVVIQPALIKGETDGIALLTQFNPHGLFIALEELGYLIMSVSFIFAGLSLGGKTKLEKWIKRIFVASFILTIGSFGFIIATNGLQREYIFELAAITFAWFTLIINGFLLFKLFKREITLAVFDNGLM